MNNKIVLGLVLVLSVVGAVLGVANYVKVSNVIEDIAPITIEQQLGGSTSDNWSVGGNLSVTGGTTLTGATTLTATTSAGNVVAGKVIEGGTVTAITTGTSTALTTAQICSTATDFTWVPIGNATMTVPHATSTFAGCLSSVGKSLDIYLRNTAATSTFTIASSTGSVLYQASTTATFAITSSTPAKLTFKQTGTSTMEVYVEKYPVVGP